MALKIIDGIIHIRRGDSGNISVTIKDEDGEPYVIEDGDTLYLTVRKKADRSDEILAQLTSYDGEFYFMPSDTDNIPIGKYSFDIQLTRANGDIETVYPPVATKKYEKATAWGNFCVEAEVTHNADD